MAEQRQQQQQQQQQLNQSLNLLNCRGLRDLWSGAASRGEPRKTALMEEQQPLFSAVESAKPRRASRAKKLLDVVAQLLEEEELEEGAIWRGELLELRRRVGQQQAEMGELRKQVQELRVAQSRQCSCSSNGSLAQSTATQQVEQKLEGKMKSMLADAVTELKASGARQREESIRELKASSAQQSEEALREIKAGIKQSEAAHTAGP